MTGGGSDPHSTTYRPCAGVAVSHETRGEPERPGPVPDTRTPGRDRAAMKPRLSGGNNLTGMGREDGEPWALTARNLR